MFTAKLFLLGLLSPSCSLVLSFVINDWLLCGII